MARKLESKELAAVVLDIVVPGAGHLILDHIVLGLVFLASAGLLAWAVDPLVWFAVGVIAAVQLFVALGASSVEADDVLPREPRPATKPKPKPEPKPVPQPVAKVEPTKKAEPEARREPIEIPDEPQVAPAAAKPAPAPAPAPAPKIIPADRYPHEIDKLDKKLTSLKGTMGVAKQWHESHFGLWNQESPRIADGAPPLLAELANELGGVEFEATWAHGWKFAHDDIVGLFNVVEPVDIGWRFGHRTADSGSLELIWLPNNSVVRRRSGSVVEIASSLGEFLEQFQDGLRVAQMALAAEALMDPKQLTVLPESEREESDPTSTPEFPSFWLGAEGPGLLDVWFEFSPPYIEHAEGSRVADAMDAAIIDAFAEWFDTSPQSPEGALELARKRSAQERPVAWITRDDELVVAWWVETPPGEVDAFLDHLRSVVYYKG